MIQGYPDDASGFPGDTITFHVSTDAPQFRIDFYRQGVTLNKVLSSNWMPGVFADDHDPDQDWGVAATRRDGKPVAAWPAYPFAIPDWSTGVYIAMFVEGDGQGNPNPNQNPPLDTSRADARTGKALVVVKNPLPGVASQVLYKLPLLTYQMYNYQGGGSGYQGYWVTIIRDPAWTDLGLTPEDALTGVGFRNGGERNWPTGQNQNERVGYTVQRTFLWPFENAQLNDGDSFAVNECIVGL